MTEHEEDAGRVCLQCGITYDIHEELSPECYEKNPLEEEITRLKKLLMEQEIEIKATRDEAQRWYKAYVELERKCHGKI